MILLISPAKTLDMQAVYPAIETTQARYLDDSAELIQQLQTLSSDELRSLMGISEKLAVLNYQRFQEWTREQSKDFCPALFAFQGEVYQGIGADTFNEADIVFAQQHLRILSGLYGILRPLDGMQAYRLEMGTKLVNARGKHLYDFWGAKITEAIVQDLGDDKTPVVNLASNEYFKAVKAKLLKAAIITPIFKDAKNGQYKIISFYAKKARGLMVAYAVKHKITQVESLKAFDSAGYYYSESESSATEWVFLRDEL